MSEPKQPSWLAQWLFGPQPIVRLELLRILAPLAILGFMANRVAHADDWLSVAGFSVPDLGGDDWRQPLYIPPVPEWAAWSLAGLLVLAGLFVAIGLFTRLSTLTFALLLFYVALADRLAAFTVSKLGPLLMLALFFSPCGARYGVDAWRRQRRAPTPKPTHVSGGNVRVFQLLLPVFYFSSGVCKAHGDWLTHSNILWSYLHDSYQTPVSLLLANTLPGWSWGVFQWATLTFEYGAPLWFALRWTRPLALGVGVSMHLMIGLMFGPVLWFSLLMISLLVSSYAPERWLLAVVKPLEKYC